MSLTQQLASAFTTATKQGGNINASVYFPLYTTIYSLSNNNDVKGLADIRQSFVEAVTSVWESSDRFARLPSFLTITELQKC